MTTDSKGGFLRATFRALRAVLIVAGLLIVTLVIAASVFVREAITRLEIDPKALAAALTDMEIAAIRGGEPQQKLEAIEVLEGLAAADATPFVPALTDATKDDDPRVRRAAIKALGRVAPDAIDEGNGK